MNRPQPFSAARGAFTLIELLLVITIIGMLVAILLPALGKARDAALTTRCLANQRHLGIGYAQYVTDFRARPGELGYVESFYYNNQSGPDYRNPDYYAENDTGSSAVWSANENYSWDGTNETGSFNPDTDSSGYVGIGHVQPYVQDGRVFYCPATPDSFEDTGPAGRWMREGTGGFYQRTWLAEGISPDHRMDNLSTEVTVGFGHPGGMTISTYFYRGSGTFDYDPTIPDTDADAWGEGLQAFGTNWHTSRGRVRPDDALIHGRPTLVCHTRSKWAGVPLAAAAVKPHRALSVSLLYPDGHSKSQKLDGVAAPADMSDLKVFDKATYDLYPTGNNQFPYWWVMMERRDLGLAANF